MTDSFKKRIGSWFSGDQNKLEIGFSKSFPVAIVILDQNLKVINFTEKWKQDFHLEGIDDEDLVGRKIDNILSAIPLFQPEWMRLFKHALTGEATHKDHQLFHHDDINFDWLNFTIKPWRSSSNSVIGVIITTEKITHIIQLQKYYELAPYLLCTVSVKGYFFDVNTVFSEVLGYSKEYVLGRSLYDYIHPDDLELTAEAVDSLTTQNKFSLLFNRLRAHNGSYIQFEWSAVKELESDIFYAIAVESSAQNVQGAEIKTDRKVLEALVTVQQLYIKGEGIKELYQTTLEKLINLTDSNHGFIAISNKDEDGHHYLSILAITDMAWDENTEKYYKQYSKEFYEVHDLDNLFGKTVRQRESVIINSAETPSDAVFPVGFSPANFLGLPLLSDGKNIGVVGLMDRAVPYDEEIIKTIAPLVDFIKESIVSSESVGVLKVSDQFDKLTGLYSRHHFESRLLETQARCEQEKNQFALLYLDINRFKTINDSYGHLVGDILLEQMASRLQNSLEPSDILGRFGEDEFAIIIHDDPRLKNITRFANRLRKTVMRPYQIENQLIKISVSVGIAIYPDSGKKINELQKHADFSLHEAKTQESNVQVYSKNIEKLYSERMLIESGLDQGFSADEFYLLYQPQVDTKSNRIFGLEALIRWRHPELGLIYPGSFIPVIEELGHSGSLNLWVVKRLIKDISTFSAHAVERVTMSFNFSPVVANFHDHVNALIALLVDVTKFYKLQMEITEQNIRDPKFNLTEFSTLLAKFDLGLSIDDFGKSFSSFQRLVELPVKAIKIDSSFIKKMPKDKKTEKVVHSILTLGSSLGIDVVAEGVETNEQLKALKKAGCTLMQGIYFYKPMQINEIKKLLK